MTQFHISVLLKESLEYLQVKKGGKYIDATLGGGGHANAIVQNGGQVLGIDQDPEAIDYVSSLAIKGLTLRRGSFEHLQEIAQEAGWENCDGILFDLGVSSHQLNTDRRGFSFREEGPLDMRMNPDFGVTAKDLINALNEGELEDLFTKYGEERWAKKIAKVIVSSRVNQPIESTKQLAELVEQTVGFNQASRIHPATRVFQSLRIAVNDEINSLQATLPQALDLLEVGGRLVVISFHSLEDRVVKNFFKERESLGKIAILTSKPVEPTEEEVAHNPRARSAKLRASEKV